MPPQPKKPEAKQRSSNLEKVKELEEELSKTKYNKSTQGHIGLVKAKIALLKEKEIQRSKGKGKQEGYSVRKTGNATVIMVGFPSVGKSTLLNAITNANSAVAAYAFTTLTVIPGLLEHNHAKIQVLDVPGIVEGAASGRGRGREVLACAMAADLVIFLIDALHPEHYEILKREVHDTSLRVNQRKPDVKLVKKDKGGINILSTVKLTKMDKETMKKILEEFRISNVDLVVRTDIDADQLIDVIESNKKYIPAITVVNKMDIVSEEQLMEIKESIKPDIFISAEQKVNTGALKDLIFKKLDFIRIYLKEIGKKPDMEEPVIMLRGCTLEELCRTIHKDFVDKFKFARVWGASVKFPGQALRKISHFLLDNDVVELHLN